MQYRYIFGPVKSRRLGLSLGINNVNYKTCTYSCIYCQVGRTTRLTIDREKFYNIDDIYLEVFEIIKRDIKLDYITFVPDGEPTLDVQLGKLVEKLRDFEKPLAILTNSSLLWRSDVLDDLKRFDYVSLKIDTVHESTWRRINRPHSVLKFEDILNSIERFSKTFNKTITIEVMIVKNVNDYDLNFEDTARFIKKLSNVKKVYLAIPVRPPCEAWVKPPSSEVLVKAYNIFSKILNEDKVEVLSNLEENIDNVENSLSYILRTINVHPLKYEYALKILSRDYNYPEKVIEELVGRGLVSIVDYLGTRFLIRKFT